MKKIAVTAFILITYTCYPQNPIEGVLRTYFQTHPFTKKGFTHFITALQKNRWFKIEEYKPRTDSSFFFLIGTYKYFNPFKYYIPEELRLAVIENVHAYPKWNYRDTIIFLQLSGITDTGKDYKKIVQKEFRRFHNNQAYRFGGIHTYQDFGLKGQRTAEVYSYYILPSVEPMTIAWDFLPETNQYAFTITIPFRVHKDIAYIDIAPPRKK